MSSLTPELMRQIALQTLSAPQGQQTQGQPAPPPGASDQGQASAPGQSQQQSQPAQLGSEVRQSFDQARGDVAQAAKNTQQAFGGAKKSQQAATTAGQQAAVAQYGVDSEKQQGLKEVFDKIVPQLDALDAKTVQIQDDAQKATAAQMEKNKAAASAVQNYQFQNYFADKSTFGKIMGVVAATLGGAANGLAGNPGAPTALDRLIEQDMALQQANFAKVKENSAQQRGILSDMREQTGDLMSAQAAMKRAVYDKVGVLVQQVGAKLGTPQAQLQATLAALAQKQAESDQQLASAYSNSLNSSLLHDSGILVQKAGLLNDLEKMTMAMQEKKDAAAAKGNELTQQGAISISRAQDAMGLIDEAIKDPMSYSNPDKRAALEKAVADAMSDSPRGANDDLLDATHKQVTGPLDLTVKGYGIPISGILRSTTGFTDEQIKNLKQLRDRIAAKAILKGQAKGGGDVSEGSGE